MAGIPGSQILRIRVATARLFLCPETGDQEVEWNNWLEREQWLIATLQTHPCSTGQLIRKGVFPSRQVASRKLKRLRKRGEVKLIGYVSLNRTGHPDAAYFARNIKTDLVLHEVLVSEFLLFMDCKMVRGADVEDRLLP